ncbi:MAG: TrbI/VirB10 family protein [Candidatus Sulfotelmatobacter sp.]
MKKFLITLFAAGLMLSVATAQGTAPAAQAPSPQVPPSSPASAQAAAPARIAPGSVIPVSLTKTIDAKKAKTGDEIVARVTQDMKTPSGEVLVPKDTKVMGHVTEAQPRNKEQKESQVGIAFDRAVMKDGSAMQMPMSIQAIIGEQNNQNNPGGASSDATAPSDSPSAAPASGSRPGMAGSVPAPTSSAGGNDMPSNAPTGENSRPPITAQTEGVVGISNLTLTPTATNAAEGSVVSSDKNNVKLESGTMMLLRVNQ